MYVTMMGQAGRPTSHYLLYLHYLLYVLYPALSCLGLFCLSFSILFREIIRISFLSLSSEP